MVDASEGFSSFLHTMGAGSRQHRRPGILLRPSDALPDAGQLQSEDRSPGVAAAFLAELSSLELVRHRLSTLLQSILLSAGTHVTVQRYT